MLDQLATMNFSVSQAVYLLHISLSNCFLVSKSNRQLVIHFNFIVSLSILGNIWQHNPCPACPSLSAASVACSTVTHKTDVCSSNVQPPAAIDGCQATYKPFCTMNTVWMKCEINFKKLYISRRYLLCKNGTVVNRKINKKIRVILSCRWILIFLHWCHAWSRVKLRDWSCYLVTRNCLFSREWF